MARYYLDRTMTISGLEPDSMVAIWRGEPSLDNDPVHLGRSPGEEMSISVPNTSETLHVRVRKYGFRSFDTKATISNTDGFLMLTQIRDV